MPLVVHSRDDFVGTYELMRAAPNLKRYLHCRSYTPHELSQLAVHFSQLRVGRCCNMTYPKAQALRESLVACQTTNIQWLLETDAPYLSPQGKRGEKNTSANISALYFAVSELLDLPLIEVQKTVAKNFIELYKI